MKLILPTILAAIQKSLRLADFYAERPKSRTPSIIHRKHHGQTQARIPNDGRWHMKFHRGRI